MSHMNHHDPSLTQSQSLRTPEASPRNTNSDGQSLHNIDSLNHERLSNSGISALIGQDSRGTVSPAPFSTRSQSITERPELSVQTSQSDSSLLKSTPPGGPFMAASWESPTNNMNDWPNRLFTTSPPASGGIQYEYRQPLDQQNLASIQSPTQQLIQPHLPPVFQPPHGSLELFNLRVWEDCRGNNPNYWETVYNAVLDLQTRYGELVIQGTATAKEPRYKCGVCNHRSVRNPSRNKDTSQRRWDLSPHILTHARSPIKPWFSACGRSYGRSHDQRRHSENCPICKNDAVAHSAPQDPTVFSQPPVPAPRPFAASGEHPNALIHAPFPHPPHQHIQPPVANQTTAHISGHAGPSVGPNQHHPKGNMPSGSGRTFDGRHMTHEDHRERTMWAQTASHHRTPSIELPTPTNVGNAVMLQPRQAQSQMPFSPIEQPSGHCFSGYTYPDRQASWMPAQEKGAEVSKQGSMLSSCDDLSSMEKGSKKTRCNHESKITHRKDHTAVALGLIFAFMVFYFGLRWYLLG